MQSVIEPWRCIGNRVALGASALKKISTLKLDRTTTQRTISLTTRRFFGCLIRTEFLKCNSRVAVLFLVCYGSGPVHSKVILNPQKEDVMMKEEEIKEHLMSSSADFRRLAEEHQQHETKLQELLSHSHLSEQDHLEEMNLKKKKLQLKDQMNSMVLKFKNELSHQPT